MFFATLKKMIFRLCTTLLAVVLYVGAAVLLPDHLRAVQRFIGDVFNLLEQHSTIPSQYFLWLDMSGIESVLIFALFYILGTFLLLLLWRSIKATFRGLWTGVKALFKRNKKQTLAH